MSAEFAGRRATVMGLGLFGGGLGVAKFLARRGAQVTVTDRASAEKLAPSIEALRGLDVRFVLGRHDEADFESTDLVVASPAVKIADPLLELARSKGIPVKTEILLFLERCRAPVIAVTGSIGKTTTTSLLADMVSAGGRRVWLGGNIGRSLLEDVRAIRPDDRVVLELSSFQLEHLGRTAWRPSIAVVTNLRPNHLDWHGDMAAYALAKSQIARHQDAEDQLVLNADDPALREWEGWARSRVRWFARSGPRAPGLWDDQGVARSTDDPSLELFRSEDLRLRGRFHFANALAAASGALAAGVPAEAILRAVRDFEPVEHRLEWVARKGGVDWYNDSKATTADSTIAALEALERPIVLIAGGSDKSLPLEELARAALERASAIVLVGPMGPRLRAALAAEARPGSPAPDVAVAARLAEAVEHARRLARPGSNVLLSPATASYDEFSNFEERGRRFKELVGNLPWDFDGDSPSLARHPAR